MATCSNLSTVKRKAWCMGRQRNATVVRLRGVRDHTGEQQGVVGSSRNPHMADSDVPVGAEEFYDNVRGASRLLPEVHWHETWSASWSCGCGATGQRRWVYCTIVCAGT